MFPFLSSAPHAGAAFLRGRSNAGPTRPVAASVPVDMRAMDALSPTLHFGHVGLAVFPKASVVPLKAKTKQGSSRDCGERRYGECRINN
jgi:hypothetical protein